MNRLDDTSRTTYRHDLYAEVVYERFGPIPWRELHHRPEPAPTPLIRIHEPAAVTARRRAILRTIRDRDIRTETRRAA